MLYVVRGQHGEIIGVVQAFGRNEAVRKWRQTIHAERLDLKEGTWSVRADENNRVQEGLWDCSLDYLQPSAVDRVKFDYTIPTLSLQESLNREALAVA